MLLHAGQFSFLELRFFSCFFFPSSYSSCSCEAHISWCYCGSWKYWLRKSSGTTSFMH